MADPTPTREETVKANLADTIALYNKDAHNKIVETLLTDIDISLALLVDAGSDSST